MGGLRTPPPWRSRFSKSLATRRYRFSHTRVLSTTHRRGKFRDALAKALPGRSVTIPAGSLVHVRTFFVGLYCHCNPSRYGLIGAKLTWARPLRLHPPALPSLRQRSPVRPSLTSPPFHSLALQRATLKDASRREERWPRGPSLTAARRNAPGVGRSGRRDGPSVEQRDGWTDRPR